MHLCNRVLRECAVSDVGAAEIYYLVPHATRSGTREWTPQYCIPTYEGRFLTGVGCGTGMDILEAIGAIQWLGEDTDSSR